MAAYVARRMSRTGACSEHSTFMADFWALPPPILPRGSQRNVDAEGVGRSVFALGVALRHPATRTTWVWGVGAKPLVTRPCSKVRMPDQHHKAGCGAMNLSGTFWK